MDKKIAKQILKWFTLVYFAYAVYVLIVSLLVMGTLIPALALPASFGVSSSLMTIASLILGLILEISLVVLLWKLIKGKTSVFKYIAGIEVVIFAIPLLNMLSLPVPAQTMYRVLLATSIKHLVPVLILYVLLRSTGQLAKNK